jgi:hypothetical protein
VVIPVAIAHTLFMKIEIKKKGAVVSSITAPNCPSFGDSDRTGLESRSPEPLCKKEGKMQRGFLRPTAREYAEGANMIRDFMMRAAVFRRAHRNASALHPKKPCRDSHQQAHTSVHAAQPFAQAGTLCELKGMYQLFRTGWHRPFARRALKSRSMKSGPFADITLLVIYSKQSFTFLDVYLLGITGKIALWI